MQCYPFIHSDDPSAEPVENLQLVCAHDCPAQSVEWLWPDKIPIGKVTLLIGDPGTGKSLVALDIAARVSRGSAWPDDGGPLAPREELRLAERDNYLGRNPRKGTKGTGFLYGRQREYCVAFAQTYGCGGRACCHVWQCA